MVCHRGYWGYENLICFLWMISASRVIVVRAMHRGPDLAKLLDLLWGTPKTALSQPKYWVKIFVLHDPVENGLRSLIFEIPKFIFRGEKINASGVVVVMRVRRGIHLAKLHGFVWDTPKFAFWQLKYWVKIFFPHGPVENGLRSRILSLWNFYFFLDSN